MLSLRLPQELEGQLDLESLRTGLSKNAIAQRAIQSYMTTLALADAPVDGPVLEATEKLWAKHQAGIQELYKQAHQVADWINRKALWTKRLDPNADGASTPGVYGRNIVVGFTDNFGDLHVISRNLRTEQCGGTDRHHMYVTSYDDWLKYMVEIQIQY